MNSAFCLIFFIGFITLSQGVILSLEEAELGEDGYRYFYLTVPDIDGGSYQKPYFTLVNSEQSRPYGALGSLTCGTSTDGIAVYMDVGNDYKEWTCQSINLLPFAHQGGGAPNPPICSVTAPDGLPVQWNATSGEWICGDYNQVLTLTTRIDGSPCVTADFLMYYGAIDAIRCVDPREIDPASTDTSSSKREIETRVDVTADKKWLTIMSDMDCTGQTTKLWNFWRWTNYMNYDSSISSSQVSTPPRALPFNSTLVAVSVASFKVTSYSFVILPPSSTDQFTVVLSRLSNGLGETIITNSLVINSVSATSGQVTFSLAGNTAAVAAPGESFVGGVTARSWGAFSQSSDRHLIALTLWIQTTASFTQYFPLT